MVPTVYWIFTAAAAAASLSVEHHNHERKSKGKSRMEPWVVSTEGRTIACGMATHIATGGSDLKKKKKNYYQNSKICRSGSFKQ